MTTEARIDKIIGKLGQTPLALLYVSIGPVQEFIAEARKMRDLWVGSYLLYKVTLETISHYGHEVIIMPDICASMGSSPRSTTPVAMAYASLPNHFLTIVPDDKVEDITKEMMEKTEEFLKKLGETVKGEIDEIANKDFSNWADLWDFQLKDHFQVMWVSIPVTENELRNGYHAKHNEIQRFMEERKITRKFNQWQGNSAPKCSQCGHREVMGPPGFKENGEFWNLLRGKGRTRWVLNKSEKLCAVCLLKRMVKESELSVSEIAFDSTSDIASIPFRKALEGNKGNEVVKAFVDKVGKLYKEIFAEELKGISEIPGDWMYKEALVAKRIIKEYRIDESNKDRLKSIEGMTEEAREALEKTYASLKFKPSKYYAILMLDADKMGEYLSGKKLPAGVTFSLEWQIAESSKLVSLGSNDWPVIIQEWGGAIIYSGGDDLLAFGPLMGALDAVWKLKEAFCKTIETTISGSMVIVHHTDSLRRALEDARSGLDMAKEVYERDSLVITLKLSSGSSYMGGYKWGIDSGVSFVQDFIGNLANWMSQKKTGLSPAFIYDLLKETDAFYYTDNRGKIHLKMPDMLAKECGRLLKRHIPEKSPIWQSDREKIKKIMESLVKIANPEKNDVLRYSFDTKENLESLLKIIAFLARERSEG